MTGRKKNLASFSKEKRRNAQKKYKVIEPFLKDELSLADISSKEKIPVRTLSRWKQKYLTLGLVGLIREERSDKGTLKLPKELITTIEQLVLKNKKMSVATIHRKIVNSVSHNQETKVIPSYDQVYKVVKNMDASLIYLSHHGKKKYEERFDLVHITEANYPNEIWQADHTLLDIEIFDEKGQKNRPWLTIILDDYSRCVAGYNLSFDAPNALRTSLTLHQAIWTKRDSEWPICGIPETFYTDHGSDFTSEHLEQIAADLRINLIFSKVGVPRVRGKIERFFQTVNQLFLENQPGYIGNSSTANLLTIHEFKLRLHDFLIKEYNYREHSSIKMAPIYKWNESNFLPNMPENLEMLDLLLLEVAKTRKVHPDGVHFQGIRYTNPNLVAYVGEYVLIRYNPADLVEIRIYYENKYLCNGISPELSNYSVDLNELVSARNKRQRTLQEKVHSPSAVDLLIGEKKKELQKNPKQKKSKLKRYYNE
ncbi:Mu transposase C-terminal domain-containing protein [Enterococcus faecalis]|uniref:Mu transposase C-terminal domain-containing protein n=2 Tax=Enterococcus faecalis TaxID=1351 RepID=UPI001156FC51|nr:Mu transposase C-terminal domain-containing protein [Enterococcus faecalis]